ncbi:MAG: tetratricopeptide repeat protein [Cyanobacteria bacterium P01_F01_bin.150]
MDYQQALQDIRAGRFETAIAQLDELIQSDASQPKVWQAKAVALLSSGSVDAAIVAAEQVLRLNPAQADAHQLLGTAYKQQGDLPQAIAAYKQATRCYLNHQNKAKAQSCITQIEQLSVQLSSHQNAHRVTSEKTSPSQPQTRQRSESSTRFASPVSNQPLPSPVDFLAEAIAKGKRGKRHEALSDLNWLLELDPNDVDGLAHRGMLHAQTGNHRAAIRDLERAMALAPDNPKVCLLRSRARLYMGDDFGAIADLSHLLQNQADNQVMLYYLRGRAYLKIRNVDQAIRDCETLVSLDANYAEGYELGGAIYESIGKWEDAIAHYRKAEACYSNQEKWSVCQRVQRHIQYLEAEARPSISERSTQASGPSTANAKGQTGEDQTEAERVEAKRQEVYEATLNWPRANALYKKAKRESPMLTEYQAWEKALEIYVWESRWNRWQDPNFRWR